MWCCQPGRNAPNDHHAPNHVSAGVTTVWLVWSTSMSVPITLACSGFSWRRHDKPKRTCTERETHTHEKGRGDHVHSIRRLPRTLRSASRPSSPMALSPKSKNFKVTFALSTTSTNEAPYKKQHTRDTLPGKQRQPHRHERDLQKFFTIEILKQVIRQGHHTF